MVEEEKATFTISIPKKINDKIENLTKTSLRSKNAEITILLEEALKKR